MLPGLRASALQEVQAVWERSACQPSGTHTCWALTLLRHAFHSLLLDSGHPREGPRPLLQPTHTPGTRLPGGFLSSSFTSNNHRVINQATSCLAFPLPSLPLFLYFPKAPKEAVASQRTAPFSVGLGPSFLKTYLHTPAWQGPMHRPQRGFLSLHFLAISRAWIKSSLLFESTSTEWSQECGSSFQRILYVWLLATGQCAQSGTHLSQVWLKEATTPPPFSSTAGLPNGHGERVHGGDIYGFLRRNIATPWGLWSRQEVKCPGSEAFLFSYWFKNNFNDFVLKR